MSGRGYVSQRDLLQLDQRLSERDRRIVKLIGDLKLVSGNQVRRVVFEGAGTGRHDAQLARRALLRLTRAGLLDRLERRVGGVKGGSDAFVFRLASHGARLVSFWNGGGLVRGRSWPEPGARFVQHRLRVSELYVRLSEAAAAGRLTLACYEAEPTCWRSFVGATIVRAVLKPDAFVRISVGRYDLWWMVEVDLGTVAQSTRAAQAAAYRAYWHSGAAGEVMPRVLWLGSTERVVRRAALAIRPDREDGRLFVVAAYDEAVPVLAGGVT